VSNLKRHIGQKVALAAAAFCALLALPVFGLFVWLFVERGMGDTWTPSALTTVFFLVFCAVVLYVTSRPQPPLPPLNPAVDA
jgi:predicted neutral ceramidase superfamily lipid hydrolase